MKQLNAEQEQILAELFSNYPVPTNLNNQNEKEQDKSNPESKKSELITSVCIENIVTKRNLAVTKLQTALKLLAEASELAQAIGGDGLSVSDLNG